MEPRDFKEALNKAKRALHKYYRENHLDPAKDYSKDPIHGDMVTNLILRLNKERDKLERKFPIIKIKSNLKFVRTMAKNIKEAKASKKEKKVKATVTEVETKKSKKEKDSKSKKESTKKPSKYDYPLIDGREMNSIEKKKYRMEQRKLKAKEGKEESKESKPTSKKVKKEETSKKVKKEKTSKDVKKKKVKKEED